MTTPIDRPNLGGIPLHMRGYTPPPKPQAPGSFKVLLGPTLFTKTNLTAPDKLYIGLLTKAPKIEGNGWVELDAPNYERQLLVAGPGTAAYQIGNRTKIEFGPMDEAPWPQATHAAAFDEAGTLLYYGLILPQTSGIRPTDMMEFHLQTVQVKLPINLTPA